MTEPAVPEDVLVDVAGSIANVTINRPDKRNAVTTGMWLRIAELMPEFAATPGVRLIVIRGAGGVFSAGDAPGAQQLDADEIRAITSEAHALGLKVAAHAHGDAGIRASIDNGVDTIEHASLASDATIADAKAHGTWFDMDIYNDDYILATGTSNGTSQESLDKEKALGLKQRQTFQRAVRAGVPMLFGTDAGVYPHGQNARQFAKMVEWGMTPLGAIRAATLSAAEALDRPGDVGQIAPGHFGDLVAVKGDPLQDVRTLEHPDAVVKGGKLVIRTAAAQ
jgi:imidazolonepropionase-like amidohydrolase